jgi:hypothetical protein
MWDARFDRLGAMLDEVPAQAAGTSASE